MPLFLCLGTRRENKNSFNPNAMDMSFLLVMVDRKRGKDITNDLPQSALTPGK